MSLLLVHLTATAVLAGLGWTVQRVVYPSIRLVGGQSDGAVWAAW